MQVHNIEQAVYEVLELLLAVEGEEPIVVKCNTENTGHVPPTPRTRRGSVPVVEFSLPPGEKAAMKKKQMREELKQEAIVLMGYFNRKTLDTLIRATRVTLEKIRRALSSPSSLMYGSQPTEKDDRTPVLKLQLSLTIPNITVSPSLDDIQNAVNQVVQTILSMYQTVYQWGQSTEAGGDSVEDKSLSSVNILTSPSQMNAPKKTELKNFHRMVSEHKDIAKLISSLSSVITSAKNTVNESFSHFNNYKDLWEQEQESKMIEFMEQEPLLGDFEAEIHHYEQLEGEIMAEEEYVIIGALYLQTSKN